VSVRGNRQLIAIIAVACVAAAATLVALAFGQDAAMAAAGGGLAVAYAALDMLFVRLAASGSFSHALVVGLGGMAVRIVVVLAGLVAVGVADREAFAECSLAFLAGFTVFLALRATVAAPTASPR
jgi:hypothetical protein